MSDLVENTEDRFSQNEAQKYLATAVLCVDIVTPSPRPVCIQPTITLATKISENLEVEKPISSEDDCSAVEGTEIGWLFQLTVADFDLYLSA